MRTKTIKFDADYGRTGVIMIVHVDHRVQDLSKPACAGCKATSGPMLYVDSSEGEYGGGYICRACVAKLFDAAGGAS